jgi:hypothetical protein
VLSEPQLEPVSQAPATLDPAGHPVTLWQHGMSKHASVPAAVLGYHEIYTGLIFHFLYVVSRHG